MTDRLQAEVTTILRDAQAGGTGAQDRLVGVVYGELRRMAAGMMSRERSDHTLQPTALVHEALVRMLDQDALRQAPNRRWLFAAAARAMRQVLVDHARTRSAAKRAGDRDRVPLDEALAHFEAHDLEVLAVHEGLEKLAELNERQAKIVEMRFFGGFSVEEVAEALGVSVSLVESDFRKARAFLKARLDQEG
jgi:RNA polymerase sigma factor (TIGR02999 family)